MTELSSVLKTYQDNALKTLQGPASLFYSGHQFSKGLKRELDSPPPPASPLEEYTKRFSPSPTAVNASTASATLSVAERTTEATPPQREYCPSPVGFVQMKQPIQSQPILTAPDSERGELMECIIEGKAIGCFQLGGELRLCVPQIFQKILIGIPLPTIHQTIEDLHISCLQSTPKQTSEFKRAEILPLNVPPCGLITRTNAERLCSTLLHKSTLKKKELNNYFSFRVYHRCFGKCEGICTPELFSFTDRACIECVECHGMMPPNKFVLHVCKDKPKENFTCHWGFESNRWLSYIHVSMSEPNQEKCTRLMEEMFSREIDFERVLYEQRQLEESNNYKRKVRARQKLFLVFSFLCFFRGANDVSRIRIARRCEEEKKIVLAENNNSARQSLLRKAPETLAMVQKLI